MSPNKQTVGASSSSRTHSNGVSANCGLSIQQSSLRDNFDRLHTNLRISVTDRCNLRCTYCMPESVSFVDQGELLSFEEIIEFVQTGAALGIDKIRLTGGEPLMRRGLPDLVRMLLSIPGIRDVGLTTNAILLAAQSQPLYDAGLRRLNISLDTLDPDRFLQLSRRRALEQVLEGIEAARTAGFECIKINAVVIRGVNDFDVVPLARYARDRGLEMRYIEYMPIGSESWNRERAFLAHEILDLIERDIGPLVPAEDYDPQAPAMDFRYQEGGGRVGIIASVSRPFCRRCNRLRLTAEGKVRNCLFALNELDAKPLLRPTVDREGLKKLMRQSVASKWAGHEFNSDHFVKPERTMHSIGG